MERLLSQDLQSWKSSERRKPLILRGARQLGKTHLLRTFAQQEYHDHLYINFEEETAVAQLFNENLNPDRILKELAIYFKKEIKPKQTLLIFDEIQECPNALNSLKYICEEKNEYHLAAAGSLLGVKLTKGFPVGKVNFLDLTPLNFFEFLKAIEETSLLQLLKEVSDVKPLSEPFHNKLIKLLKYYLTIGGMPEAVATYVKNENLEEVRTIQTKILDAYMLDFAKHAPKEDLMKIMAVWNLLPSQLAKENKKFIFTAISKSARAGAYEAAIQWLVDAGLIIKVHNITTPNLPLKAYANHNAFKVFMLDVGLLGGKSKLDPRTLLQGNALFKEFKGALTENFVAQELQGTHPNELYYWSSPGKAELDFVISSQQQIFPLEVKAGLSKQKKSLLVYAKKYSQNNSPFALSRTTLRNFAYEGNIINYPLYAISLFPGLSRLKKDILST